MTRTDLNERIIARGKDFFRSIQGETPSLFNKNRWVGKVMDWCMRNEDFRLQLFRFVDVFPCLTTKEMLTAHIREYFGGDERDIPAVLKWGAQSSGLGGAIGAAILNKVIKSNIEEMARQFIVGEQSKEAIKNINKLRKQGFAFVVDVLGEATVSEEEAETYVTTYLDLLQALQEVQGDWHPLGDPSSDFDWGHAPKINVSVKPSAFYSQAKPQNFEGSVAVIAERMSRIYEKVIDLGGFLCIDMESHRYKDITLEVFRRLRLKYRDYPHLGVVLQTYLTATDHDLDDLLAWAQTQNLPISIRLVKGAYWDYETVIARQNGWPPPVYTVKAESDAAFERHAATILAHHAICHLACGSHNIRSIAAVMETARQLGVPDERYEFQVLYGMAEPVRKGLLEVAGRIRLYCPYGEMIPGMAYLVRRLLENTANESFLRQSFAEETAIARLLEDPQRTAERQAAIQSEEKIEPPALPVFTNDPAVDFSVPAQRQAFQDAIARVRNQLGKTYPLFIDGKEVATADLIPSLNPAAPAEVIGTVCLAGAKEIDLAIAAAKRAFPNWRDTAPELRAQVLRKAAEAARKRIFELAAWQVLEAGKQWDQAYADVTEGIDFLGYYACEMIRLGVPRKLGRAPGEDNRYGYEPRGVAAVISPWNFPLAISCGMAAAAIVTGNCVVFKPSGLTPVIGHELVELFTAAGLPPGVFNYVPGRGSEIGDLLVEHPDISLIAFTGSMEVGLRLAEKAARVHPGQRHVKRVVAEMGGKNAIIIDDDADLDEAVPHVLYSAFGYQGQKCSACSRVIVLDTIHDQFVERLVKAAKSLKIGPAEDPANFMGPVVDGSARNKVIDYIDLAQREGEVLYRSETPADGFYVPLTIVGGIRPEHRIAQEEVFGPLLAVMRASTFEQAIEWANSTRFALTGGVFSRSPAHLERARRDFRVGNLYLNRNCVGALVERQPFGGAAMSGLGTKAGGPDYLLHFMDPRTVTENTMRRGFAPTDV
ncbi:MAG: L-glutamate gamma-semialdehyde dehydrogenase [Desulfuromonadaceae bacterium GWC2_58_13]|nr:MAG: L-glutamate gamma-semialdehyde dehydrogenase [Desulfuromonadaceae bacterium GWC2_58_13]